MAHQTHQHGTDDAGYEQEVAAFRHEKDHFFASSPQSPIPREERRGGFAGLSYYPPDAAYRVEARVAPIEHPVTLELATSTGEMRRQVRYAELHFALNGRDLRLTGFADPGDDAPDELFIPFRDATSGKETYGAGRYLEVALERGPGGTTAALDFNLAYNPYCAYSMFYSCPLPPAENTLSAAIEAGERDYAGGH